MTVKLLFNSNFLPFSYFSNALLECYCFVIDLLGPLLAMGERVCS